MHYRSVIVQPIFLPRDVGDVGRLVVAVAHDDGVVFILRAAFTSLIRHAPLVISQRSDVEDSGAEGRLDTEFLGVGGNVGAQGAPVDVGPARSIAVARLGPNGLV